MPTAARALSLTLLAGIAVDTIGLTDAAAPSSEPRPAQIDRAGVLILVRSTLIAVQQANDTGNYTVLRDLSAPGFRERNTAAQLGDIFGNLRTQHLDLSGTLTLDPQLTLLPQIESNGMLHMTGYFPSAPMQLNFDLTYAPVDGRWRLFGISLGMGSASPVAPLAPPPEHEAQPPAAPQAKVKHRSKPIDSIKPDVAR